MLVKSVIAGTVLSLMAGGVVYFGTDVDTAAVKTTVLEKTTALKADVSDKLKTSSDDHPHGKKDSMETSKTSENMPSVKTDSGKTIEAKKPTISYANEKTRKTAEGIKENKTEKKWLDTYLKKQDDTETKTVEFDEKTEVASADTAPDTAKELMDRMGLTKDGGSDSDTASFKIEDKSGESLTKEQIEMAEAEGFEERALETDNIWTEDSSSATDRKTSTRKMLHDIIKKDRAVFIGEDKDGKTKNVEVKVMANEDGETTIKTETIDIGDGKTMKIIKKTMTSEKGHGKDGKKMRIKIMTDKEGKGGVSAENIEIIRMGENVSIDELMKEAKSKDISGTVKVVMEQAEKIEMPELRDRAYLDLVSYGLEHGNYKVAAKALKKIEQVELRDTARNRIAVAHAQDGNAKDAFEILEDIEVEALRDVMRLQVIEAMIAPDQLPEDMQ